MSRCTSSALEMRDPPTRVSHLSSPKQHPIGSSHRSGCSDRPRSNSNTSPTRQAAAPTESRARRSRKVPIRSQNAKIIAENAIIIPIMPSQTDLRRESHVSGADHTPRAYVYEGGFQQRGPNGPRIPLSWARGWGRWDPSPYSRPKRPTSFEFRVISLIPGQIRPDPELLLALVPPQLPMAMRGKGDHQYIYTPRVIAAHFRDAAYRIVTQSHSHTCRMYDALTRTEAELLVLAGRLATT